MSPQYVKAEYPLSDITARIIATAQEVHRAFGPGFEEAIYPMALTFGSKLVRDRRLGPRIAGSRIRLEQKKGLCA